MRRHLWILALVIVCGWPTHAAAQARRQKGPPTIFVTAGVMSQPTRSTFNDTISFTVYAEDGTIQEAFKAGRGLRMEFGGGVRVGGKFTVGALVSVMSVDGPIAVTASIPHPFFFNQPRTAAGASTAQRDVRDIDMQIMYLMVDSEAWQIAVGGGPSLSHVTQDVGTGLQLIDVYPYDTVAISSVTMTKTPGTHIGVNVGAGITRALSSRLGITGDVRWTSANVPMNATTPTGALKIQTGGIQVGGRVRVLF